MSAIVIDPLPERWKAVRLKFFTSRLYGLSQPPEYQSEGLPFVRATNVLRGKLVTDGLVFVSEFDLSEPRAVRLMAGDIIVVRSGAYTGDSALVTADWVGGVAGFDIVVRVHRYAHPRFVAFSLLSPSFLEQQIEPIRGRAAQPHLNAEELGDVELMLPPLDEQRAIADYLDRETARLDGLVSAKERVLELLAEKRRALITRAVTCGLDPRAPLRDSGIPWLGKIPAYWEVKRLKFTSPEITVGIVVTPAKYYESAGVPCLRSLNVREEGLTDSDLVYISDESNALLAKSRVFLGDLVAVRSGQPGTTAVVDERFDGANCIDLIIIRRPPAFVSAFLSHFLNSQPAKMQFLSGSGGAIQQHFNIETAKDLIVPVPPLEEQCAIVAHIATATAKLDALRSATERTIALLKERRTALIAAAVTGRLHIPEAA